MIARLHSSFSHHQFLQLPGRDCFPEAASAMTHHPCGWPQPRRPRRACRTLTTLARSDSTAASLFAPHSPLSDSFVSVTTRARRLARFEIPVGFYGRLSRALLPEYRCHFARLFFTDEARLLRPPDWPRAAF